MTKKQFKRKVCVMNLKRMHLCSKENERQELVDLLFSAKDYYQLEVINGGKSYERFAEDYINRNTFIDSNCVICKNVHVMNLNIVKGILENRQLVDRYLFCNMPSHMSVNEMIDIYNGVSKGNTPGINCIEFPLSFDCVLKIEQLTELTELIRKQGMFRVEDLSVELVENLFQCKKGGKITIHNLRKTSVMFDAMANRKMITPSWQSVIVRGGFFQSKKDGKDITRENLANSLSSARVNGMSYIKVINEWVENIKNLSK